MKFPIAITFIALFSVTISACSKINILLNTTAEKRQIEDVCAGKGISNAAEYPSSSDIHPIYIVSKGDQNWNDQLPIEWRHESIESLELVGCAGQMERKEIETCKNILGSYNTRYKYEMKFRLVEAKTGDEVTSYTFHGGEPGPCTPEGFSPDWVFTGSEITFKNQIENWLCQYVEY
jgi:hypothetical protein